MDPQPSLSRLFRTSEMLPLLGRILDQPGLIGVNGICACANSSLTAAAGGQG